MQYISEEIPLESIDFPFNLFESSGWDSSGQEFTVHNHRCLEINYAVSGTGRYRIGENEYEIHPGDLFVINNCEYHMALNRERLVLKVLVFNPDMVWRGDSTMDYNYLQAFFEWKESFKHQFSQNIPMVGQVFDLMLKIQQEWQNRKVGYRLLIKSYLLEILAHLYRGFESAEPYARKILKFQSDYNRIVKAVAYIEQNYTQDISLKLLAELVHMSPNYFSKYFKTVMSDTVVSYINKKRVDHTCMLLRTTKMTVSEAAMNSGFADIPHFNKVFKDRVGMAPLQFRRERQAVPFLTNPSESSML